MTSSANPPKVKSIAEWKSLGLDFAIELDRHRWSDSESLNRATREALRWCGLDNKSSGHKALNVRLMKVILQNLFAAYSINPSLFCSYSRNKNDYVFDRRYNPNRFSFKAVSLMDALAREGMIENYPGVQFGESFKRRARMRLTPFGAKQLMKEHGITLNIAMEKCPEEYIILRKKRMANRSIFNTETRIAHMRCGNGYNTTTHLLPKLTFK